MEIQELARAEQLALRSAIEAAQAYRGATSPNPPVGAAALDPAGQILSVRAHTKAGEPHAEASVLKDLRARGIENQAHTLIVTLEPCNHQGRTPACSQGILATPSIRKVIYASPDPNPRVKGGGAEALRQAGLEVELVDSPEARDLIAPFSKWSRTGIPWITVKTAWRLENAQLSGAQSRTHGMIPPPGQKTFTSPESLRFAHILRKRADAILTGSGTVLADRPELTVRHIPDHAGKRRFLAVLDRSGRVPADWLEGRKKNGFEPVEGSSVPEILEMLGQKGVLEVLVEAGPSLSGFILEQGLWDEHFRIEAGTHGEPDKIYRSLRERV